MWCHQSFSLEKVLSLICPSSCASLNALFAVTGCLALPKLNLQFLTLHDYLLRNLNLFRLESTCMFVCLSGEINRFIVLYHIDEIKEDIEDIVSRMKPWYVEVWCCACC